MEGKKGESSRKTFPFLRVRIKIDSIISLNPYGIMYSYGLCRVIQLKSFDGVSKGLTFSLLLACAEGQFA
jgi:hypothetical protein